MPLYSTEKFKVDDVAMRYSNFAPRLYNFCLSLGMQENSIMPSRAFCSDESQGYPIILIAKHFGTFPFNHGIVGGIVATDRHGPHADHGKDMVIIQASHVGYDPDSDTFGTYKRLQTENHTLGHNCGAICGALSWYEEEYNFARQHIFLDYEGDTKIIVIDNQLLHENRQEGLFLNTDKLVSNSDTRQFFSTARSFIASDELIERIGKQWPKQRQSIDAFLFADMFSFKRNPDPVVASAMLHQNLIDAMPYIITSKEPALAAAKRNSQVEFDRAFRTIVKEKAYRGKKILFISGIHIDISPRPGLLFPLTKFIPWAAYIQNEQGEGYTVEQDELYKVLKAQSDENPHKIDLTAAIHAMEAEPEIQLHTDDK